jgi:hypothetical protein
VATEKIGTILSAVAAGPTTRYRFGKFTAANPRTAGLCTVAGEAADGVLRNTVDSSGDGVGLQLDQISFIEYGAAISIPSGGKRAVTTDDEGRAVPVAGGDAINGWALVPGVAGDIGNVLIQEGQKPIATE